MSDMDDSNVKAGRLPEPSLDTLALAELLAEVRAAGNEPRLSGLIAVLSQQAAGPLADAMMSVLLDGEDPTNDTGNEGAGPRILSAGTQRGVDAIFGVEPLALPEASSISGSRDGRNDQNDRDSALSMVAEAPMVYRVSTSAPSSMSSMENGLLALARQQGLDAQTLGEHTMLSPAVIDWLDRAALPRDQQPEALAAHLAGALGVERERIETALAQGESAADTSMLIGMLSATESLTPIQRGYWRALLASSD